MPQDNIASISLGAIHRVIVLEYVLCGIRRFVGEHATIAADYFHFQVALLDLAVLSIANASKRYVSVRIQLPTFVSSVRVGQVGRTRGRREVGRHGGRSKTGVMLKIEEGP